MTMRPSGAGSAATSRPWKRRVATPATEPEAEPPSPFVTSHSRVSNESGSSGYWRSQVIRLTISVIEGSPRLQPLIMPTMGSLYPHGPAAGEGRRDGEAQEVGQRPVAARAGTIAVGQHVRRPGRFGASGSRVGGDDDQYRRAHRRDRAGRRGLRSF